MKKKYLVCPEQAFEPGCFDNAARRLMQLYGVDPAECLVWKEGRMRLDNCELIPLLPDYTGEYRVPEFEVSNGK